MILVVAILVGLAVMRGLQTVKEVLIAVGLDVDPWLKSLFACGGACGMAYVLGYSPWLVGLGGAGVSMLLHEVWAFLQASGDERKQTVILRAGQFARRRGT